MSATASRENWTKVAHGKGKRNANKKNGSTLCAGGDEGDDPNYHFTQDIATAFANRSVSIEGTRHFILRTDTPDSFLKGLDTMTKGGLVEACQDVTEERLPAVRKLRVFLQEHHQIKIFRVKLQAFKTPLQATAFQTCMQALYHWSVAWRLIGEGDQRPPFEA